MMCCPFGRKTLVIFGIRLVDATLKERIHAISVTDCELKGDAWIV